MVTLVFVTKFFTVLVSGQEILVGAQLPCSTDEISKAESKLHSFELHEEALLDWVNQHCEASAQWHKYSSSYYPLIRRLLEAPGHIKPELCRHCLLSFYESDWGWPHKEFPGHVMSYDPYIGICESAASMMMRSLSGSSLSEIGPSVSQMMSSIVSETTVVSRVNSVGEDKSMMF